MARGARRAPASQVAEVTIAELGGRGDGIARLDGAPVYVPFALPGERLRVRLEPRGDGAFAGVPLERLSAGDARAEPACPHFGACGGCALQHLADPAYAGWKVETLRTALARQGLDEAAFEPLTRTPPGGRRRARLTVVGRRGPPAIGFNERASHRVIDLEACPVLSPRLTALLPPLRALLAPAVQPGQRLDIDALDLDGTVDLGFVAPFDPDLALREALAGFARAQDIARIVWRRSDREPPEPVVQRRPVRACFGGVAVELPPGAFLQASAEGEAALTGFATRHAEGRVLELFAGAGTFTLPLAAQGRLVLAFEGDAALVEALAAAARRGGLAGRVRAERRDLVRRPIAATELAEADCVLLDPPRAGAAEQIAGIAGSGVATVVYVSCNPVSFARDARRLAEAGFRLDRVLPVDQFLWSPHLELAATLRR